MRMLKSHSIMSKGNDYLVDSPQRNNLSYLWNFGLLLAMFLITNIFLGLALIMYLDYNEMKVINSIEHIMRKPSNKLIEIYIMLNIASSLIFLVFVSFLKKIRYGNTIWEKNLKSNINCGDIWKLNANSRHKLLDFLIRIYILLGIKLPSCFLLLTLNLPVLQVGIICAILSIVLSKFRRGDYIGYYEFFGISLCSCIITIIIFYFEPSKSVLNIVLCDNTILWLKSYIPLDIFDSVLAYILASVEISPHFDKMAIPAGLQGVNSNQKTLKDHLLKPFSLTNNATDTSNSGKADSGSDQSRPGNPGIGSRDNIGEATTKFHWFSWFMDKGIVKPVPGITDPNLYHINPGQPLTNHPPQLPPRLGVHHQPHRPVNPEGRYPPITGYHRDRNGVWNNSLEHHLAATPPYNPCNSSNVQKEGAGTGPPYITGSVVTPRPSQDQNPFLPGTLVIPRSSRDQDN